MDVISQEERRMAGLLPTGMRCSAYWYSLQLGLPLDIDSLKLLGLVAWRLAQREGLAQWQVLEGPYWVHMWPERIWDDAAAQLGVPRDHGYWAAGDYDAGWPPMSSEDM